MKRLLALAAVLVTTAGASAQCPGGVCPVPRLATILHATAARTAAVLRPATGHGGASVTRGMRHTPVRNALAGILFFRHR